MHVPHQKQELTTHTTGQEYITNKSVQQLHMCALLAFSQFDVRDKPAYKPPFVIHCLCKTY